MISKSLFILSISLSVSINQVTSIPCDFQFVENDPLYPEKVLEKIDYNKLADSAKLKPDSIDSFECEERDDNFVPDKSANTTKMHQKPDQQYFFAHPDEDDYEDSESTCQIRRRTIQPKALNNIYNQLTKVVNTASFIQSINIEQCLNKVEQCNSGGSPPVGKKYICRQKHVRITLKALRDDGDNAIVDEQFYYPSHCVCELVTKKKKRRRVSKCRPVKSGFVIKATPP